MLVSKFISDCITSCQKGGIREVLPVDKNVAPLDVRYDEALAVCLIGIKPVAHRPRMHFTRPGHCNPHPRAGAKPCPNMRIALCLRVAPECKQVRIVKHKLSNDEGMTMFCHLRFQKQRTTGAQRSTTGFTTFTLLIAWQASLYSCLTCGIACPYSPKCHSNDPAAA